MKTAIVTGASSGIGEATARVLVAAGYNVMLAARRTDNLAAITGELGDQAAYYVIDVAKPDDHAALVEATDKRFGQVDVLVCNAGIMPVSLVEKRQRADWDRMIDINMRAVMYGVDAVLPQMIERKDGHILTVSSIAGLQNFPSSSVYSATKAGIRMYCDTLRKEMTTHNIRVTTVFPGGVKTELGNSITDSSVLEMMGSAFNFEFLEPEDIANGILYALDQPSSVCVGEIMIRPTGQA